MDDHAGLRAAPNRDRHMEATTVLWQQSVQDGGAAMREQGPIAAGQDGGEAAAVHGEPGMADRVHAPVERVHPACRQAVRDPVARESQSDDLVARHDAVLGGGERGDRAIHRRNVPRVAPVAICGVLRRLHRLDAPLVVGGGGMGTFDRHAGKLITPGRALGADPQSRRSCSARPSLNDAVSQHHRRAAVEQAA
jgi:hypothetical protein